MLGSRSFYGFVILSIALVFLTGCTGVVGGAAPSKTIANAGIAVSPSTASVTAGNTVSLSAILTNASASDFQWTATGGTFTGSGASVIYNAPATAGTYTVTVSSATLSLSSSATITVTASNQPPSQNVTVSISPSTTSITVNAIVSLTATVTGTTNTAVTWSASGGIISGSGLTAQFTAPASAGTYTVTAKSADSSGASATATITVNASTQGSGPHTYFVATTGSDSNDCSSDAAPCRTIAHAVSLVVSGDTVRVHAGLYREHLNASTKNGTSGSPITLAAYGDGEVIIDSSPVVNGWTSDTGNIYKVNYAAAYPAMQVIVDNVPLAPAKPYLYPGPRSGVTISPGQFFFDINTNILYASLPDGTSPAAHDTFALYDIDHTNWVGTSTDPTRFVNAVAVGNYWIIDGLTIRGAANYGLGMGDHAVLKNSKVWFNAWTGTAFGQHSTITDNTVAWNMMANWPRGRCQLYNANQASVHYQSCWIWGSWGGGLLVGSGYSTVTGNTVYMNGGEGLISYLGAGHNYVHANTVYDNWSVNVYMDGEPYDTVDGNLVYCNDPQPSWTYNSGAANAGSAINKRLRPIGISTADECYSGCAAAQGHDETITNNVITSCRIGLTKYTQAPGSGLINEIWAHNTITLPSVNGIDFIDGGSGPDRYIGIVVNDNGNARNAYIVDNVVYGRGSTNALLQNTSTTSPQWPGITLEHNLFYHPTNPTPFQFYAYPGPGGASYSFTDWESIATGQGSVGDVFGDPLLVDPTSFVAKDKAISSTASPAKGAGLAVPSLLNDYNGFSLANPPSIGAFEYGSTAP